MSQVVVSTGINIAIIKYWGKRCEKLNLPLNSSFSITLNQDHLKTTTCASFDPNLTEDQLFVNSVEENIEKNARVCTCLKTIRELATRDTSHRHHVAITSQNNFPTAAGLASSASGYAALVASLAHLYDVTNTTDLSVIARRGSGSATRSMTGGFVEWTAGTDPDGLDSKAVQVYNRAHWPQLRVFILVTSAKRKSVPSTVGMRRSAATSSLLTHRVEVEVPRRLEAVKAAIGARDFPTFAKMAMMESNQLHAVCADSYPPIRYLSDVSYQVIEFVHAYNAHVGEERLAYSFDAGPNAFLFTLDAHAGQVAASLEHYFPPGGDKESFFRGMSYDGCDFADIGFDRLAPGALEFVICTDVGGGPVVSRSS